MAKHTYSSDIDQHDPKEFRESFGSFGTTTQPGGNQLTELQSKVRQGVKHVELHLASRGKGQFGVQDVPDKYGFEQRRTIMQLAKLNNQTLSVHASFDVTSFSGLGQQGFNESERATAIKEIDESVKFAAETAKGGAVVFHIQGDIPGAKGSLNISSNYLKWLKKNNPQEYKKVKDNYLQENPMDRMFVDNIDQPKEIKVNYENLSREKKKKFEDLAKNSGRDAWEEFYIDKEIEKAKVSPEYSPYVVVGDKISGAPREQEMVDFKSLKNLSTIEKDSLKKFDVDVSESITLEDYQKLNAIFTNGKPKDIKITDKEYFDLKNKILLNYDSVLKKNDYLQSQADKEFYQNLVKNQIEQMNLQKEDIDLNYKIHQDELAEIKKLNREERDLVLKIQKAEKEGNQEDLQKYKTQLKGGGSLIGSEKEEYDALVSQYQSSGGNLPQEQARKLSELHEKNNPIQGVSAKKQKLMYDMGQVEYQKVEKYDEITAQINEQKNKLELQVDEIKSLADETFEKNTTAMGHLGVKALRYQLDMKTKSDQAIEKKKEINDKVKQLEKQYNETSDYNVQTKLASEIQKEKYKLKQWTGVKDYEDVDIINRPLYLAPENMLPGYGSLTSIEEFKAVVRMSQQEFAKKIRSNEGEYKKLREDYEKETGLIIDSEEKALALAKRHIGGTFDNAHGATWLKHFKKEEGESEEHRVERFNKWFNSEAESMYKEGIIKHIHFNDTQGKDDDHNLIGQGILDVHDLKDRLRGAGMKEAFIVEAGGRGANNILHLQNAWDIFNPSLFADPISKGGTGYRMTQEQVGQQQVSDWVSVDRGYKARPQYSQYGMGYSAFASPVPQGMPKGDWSGQGLL